jgi:hypothetical protein
MSFAPTKTLKGLETKLAKLAKDKPKKTKQKDKTISRATKMKQPETYYYSVSGNREGKDY